MPKAVTYDLVEWRVLLPVSHRARSMYHDLGMGWFHGSFAAAGVGASRTMNSVNAMMNFVNLQNLCLAIPKFADGAGWPSGLNYQIWVVSSITDLSG